MRRGNATWINETRKKAKCNVILGIFWVQSYVTFNFHLYDYSSFDFGLETELNLHSSVAKFGKFEILDMRLAKTQFGQSICSF